MSKKNTTVILDFDGTLTDIRGVTNYKSLFEEFATGVNKQNSYWHHFFQEFLIKTGYTAMGLENLASIEKENVKNNLTKGFKLNKVDVAAANSDQYIFTETVFQNIGINNDIKNIDKIIYECHSQAYKKQTKNPFREEAKKLLDYLQKSNVYSPIIVSNSATDSIISRLKEIGMDNIPVQGNAKKLVVDSSWSDVPETLMQKPYPRKILLRRPNYGNILINIKNKHDKETKPIVIGDNFELDLAIPSYLGMDVIKINNGMDIHYERTAFKDKILFVKSLGEVMNYLESKE